MNWTQQQLVQMPDPDIIVHIGAGVCSELSDYQRIQPRQIVLVEPNPETCAELQAQAARWDNVTVLQAAVTDRTSSASLRLFNFSELDSLHEPVGLYNLLPGLRQVGRTKVATLSARQLIEQLLLDPEGQNWLVLEAPGEELEILTALADCQALGQFSHLIVRAGSEAFYNDTPSSSPAVLKKLEQLGYIPNTHADHADADWPRHHLRLQPMALECQRLHKALQAKKTLAQELEAEKQELVQRAGELLQDASKLRGENNELIARLEKGARDSAFNRKQSEQQIEDLQKRMACLEQENEKFAATLKEREKEKETLSNQKDVEFAKLRNEASSAKTEYDKLLKKYERTSQELSEIQEASTKQNRELKTERADLQEVRTGLNHRISELQSAIAAIEGERDKALRKAEERGAQLNELEKRLGVSRDELRRAEGQIGIVKDLLLREPGL